MTSDKVRLAVTRNVIYSRKFCVLNRVYLVLDANDPAISSGGEVKPQEGFQY